jgi:hypothetical protein
MGVAVVVGCGGGSNSEDPKTAASKQSLSLTPMEELQAIPKDLDAEVSGITKPIDDVQSVIDEIGALPKKHHLDAKEIMAMAKGTFENGKAEVSFKADVPAEAKADVEASMKKLAATVTALKSTPDKVAKLTAKLPELTAKVPVLTTKVTSSATVAASNPFGSAESKAKAKAEMDSVNKVQAEVSKSISDAQSKIAGLPALATSALAKLSASFAAGT